MKSMMQLALVALLVCIHSAPFTSGAPYSNATAQPTTNGSWPHPTTMYPMTTEDMDKKKKIEVELDVMGNFKASAKLNLTDKDMEKIWKKWEDDWKDMAKKMMMMKSEVDLWKMAEDILGKKGALVIMACMKGKKMEDEDNWGAMKKEMSANWMNNMGMSMGWGDMDDGWDMMDGMMENWNMANWGMDGMGDSGMDGMPNWGMDSMPNSGMDGMVNWDMEGMPNWDMGSKGGEGGDGEKKMMEDAAMKLLKFKKCMKGIMEKKKMMMKMMMDKMCMMRRMMQKMMWKKKMMMMKDGSLFGSAEKVAPVTLMMSVLGLSAHVFYF